MSRLVRHSVTHLRSIRTDSVSMAASHISNLSAGPRAFVDVVVSGVFMLFPILLLSAAGFTVLTTEFIIVGLLPSIARDLNVSVSQAGLLVTLFAFTVAAFGPFLTAYCARFQRKRLFITILIMFAVANTVAALAPNIWVMSLARLIPALACRCSGPWPVKQRWTSSARNTPVAPSRRSASGSSAPPSSAFRWAR